jgi:hypothetical protein
VQLYVCVTMHVVSAQVSTGPTLASVEPGALAGTLEVKYAAGSAQGLHTASTADCDKIGSKLCCGESPFEVRLANSKAYARVKYTIKDDTVVLGPFDANITQPAQVRYAWEQWPQCSVYNGKGAPGTGPNGGENVKVPGKTGIAGTPWCWNGKAQCAV